MKTRFVRQLSLTSNASEQVLFMSIAKQFRQIEMTQSRNAKQELFLSMLRDISNGSRAEMVKRRRLSRSLQGAQVSVNFLDQALKDYVRVSIGLFAPRFDETFEVNIAEQLTIQAIAKAFS